MNKENIKMLEEVFREVLTFIEKDPTALYSLTVVNTDREKSYTTGFALTGETK